MILEYGNISCLPGTIAVVKKDEKIFNIIPSFCEKIDIGYLIKYVRKIMKIEFSDVREVNLDYLGEQLRGKSVISFSDIESSSMTSFQRRVYSSLFTSKPGSLISYSDVMGIRYARAVGGAMKRNPLPTVIPCHRVYGKKGDEYFSIPCLKIKPKDCDVKNVQNCAVRIKHLLREFEVNE